MADPRYEVRMRRNGFWCVIDTKTSLPAYHRNHVMNRMGLDEADAAADMLNQLKRRKNPNVFVIASKIAAE